MGVCPISSELDDLKQWSHHISWTRNLAETLLWVPLSLRYCWN